MDIKSVSITNFRGIKNLKAPVALGAINFLIGDNGTGKTSILEAVNFCLSSGYVAGRLDVNDFHVGSDGPIEIVVEFQKPFTVNVPDGFTSQAVSCDKVKLTAKKREKAAPGKSFSDLVTTSHHFVPVQERGENGWTQKRKNGSPFNFDERQLLLSNEAPNFSRVFYFPKGRSRQILKGFNSSLSNIIDDLNWRFDKEQRKKSDEDHFKHGRRSLHDKVMLETSGDTLKKTIEAANLILEELGIPPVEISLFKTLSPFDNSELIFPFDGFELPVGHAGSGVEMLIALALLEAMAMLSKDKIVVLIDEPELHLHPKMQAKLVEHLMKLGDRAQIVASTHSPLLFKNCFQNTTAKLQITMQREGQVEVVNAHSLGFGYLGWSPSWGEICYLAYDFPTVEFHDDLYCSLEDQFRSSPIKRTSQADFDMWLVSKGHQKEIVWTDGNGVKREETLMTYVRNRIHHPENAHRPAYTEAQLSASIELMCRLIRP